VIGDSGFRLRRMRNGYVKLTEVTGLADARIMQPDNSSCSEQQAVATTHETVWMFAYYETVVFEMKGISA
jgi:hypothetical protein